MTTFTTLFGSAVVAVLAAISLAAANANPLPHASAPNNANDALVKRSACGGGCGGCGGIGGWGGVGPGVGVGVGVGIGGWGVLVDAVVAVAGAGAAGAALVSGAKCSKAALVGS
ncbi:hypothetical protein BX661DRAFT_196170 [Kickxella alabastrina]|uniref:uncharacterized protein n=1 Tax=Kickxella alabastrina TaxID=61397 RepID=UPI0022209E36|nr:uncharacterized protein BX661DRAFT_196170 [Kickxella alabastrina]KAI7833650.1 hypothetical protein BX661DRAFT_196170 [Kickxella alabastrina]